MAWEQIPVMIRNADEDDDASRPLGTCTSTDLVDLPNIVMHWGVVPEGEVTGQFNADLGAFQLIICDPDGD